MTDLAPDTLLLELQPKRFLQVTDLTIRWNVREIDVQIAKVTKETVTPKPGQTETQPVLYFKTKNGTVYPQGFLLAARVNVEALASATGARTIGEAIGKKIKIELGKHKGKDVLRISPKKLQ